MNGTHRLSSVILSERICGRAGIYFLDGRTMCGKTAFVNSLCKGNSDAHITTGEKLIEMIIGSPDSDGSTLYGLDSYKIICIEDIDFFGGRPATEGELARLFEGLSKACSVVVTGIGINRRMEKMLSLLDGYEYYLNDGGEWELYDSKGDRRL